MLIVGRYMGISLVKFVIHILSGYMTNILINQQLFTQKTIPKRPLYQMFLYGRSFSTFRPLILYCLQVWCLTKVIWIKHQHIILFVLLWFYIWFKITNAFFFSSFFYASVVLWNNVVENCKIPVTPPTSFNMRTYFGYLCDVCIRYFLQSFH